MEFDFFHTASNLILHPVGTAAFALLLTVIYYAFKNRGIPPGPTGVPYLGYWPFLNNTTDQLDQLSKKYGRIYSFTVLGRLFISIGSAKALREAFVTKSECFEKRTSEFSFFNMIAKEGILGSSGDKWKVLQRFLLQCLKNYGLSSMKFTMAAPFYDSINDMVDELRAKKGEPVGIEEMLTDRCMLVFRRSLFNDSGLTPEKAREISKEYLTVLSSATYSSLLLDGPFAQYVIFVLTPSYRKAVKSNAATKRIFRDLIREREHTFDEHHIRDIVDSFIMERKEKKLNGDPTAAYFTDDALVAILMQMIGDGVLTVASMVAMFLEHLVQLPTEQEKIYEELIEVLGPEKQPTAEDKGSLPYTNAFIYEVLRTSHFFSIIPSMKCNKETTLGGFRIPKGSVTVLNSWSAHHDPDLYEDPYLFNPSRFITKPGEASPQLPVSFGIGKRSCTAESFVMMQIFLFVTTLVKNFNLALPVRLPAERTFDPLNVATWQICAYPREQKK